MPRILLIIAIILITIVVKEASFTSTTVVVTHIIDGDTIEIEGGKRVRYIGIDAPEIAHENAKAECYGQESWNANKNFIQGQTVRLEKDVSDIDNYGRLLRYVYVGDALINKQLVESGFARAWAVPPDVKFSNDFYMAQSDAKDANLGLWSACTK